MSDTATALNGAAFQGVVAIRESGLRGMIALRGDLSDDRIRKAAMDVAGVAFPDQRGARIEGERGLCWMSPDELLIVLPYADAGTAVDEISRALDGTHHLAVDVSDARAWFTLEGEGAAIRDVLAKLTPADLRPASLPVGEIRRTRLAQVPAAFWFHEDGRAELICFRSVGEYVWGLLTNAAETGSDVAYF